MLTIIQDTREHAEYRESRVSYFKSKGFNVEVDKLDIGDYMIKGKPEIVVDYKMSISEMIGNVQDKTISKTKIGKSVSKMCENHGVSADDAKRIYETIIADDLVVDVEGELRTLCEKAGFEPLQCTYARNLYRAYRSRLHRLNVRAKKEGVKLFYLIANEDKVTDFETLSRWRNPRLKFSPNAMTGERLAKSLQTMTDKYGCEFRFCTPENQGEEILKLLEVENA